MDGVVFVDNSEKISVNLSHFHWAGKNRYYINYVYAEVYYAVPSNVHLIKSGVHVFGWDITEISMAMMSYSA